MDRQNEDKYVSHWYEMMDGNYNKVYCLFCRQHPQKSYFHSNEYCFYYNGKEKVGGKDCCFKCKEELKSTKFTQFSGESYSHQEIRELKNKNLYK